MEYAANAKMLLWPMAIDDSLDDIPDYHGNLDLIIGSREEIQAESTIQIPKKYPEMPEEKINWQEQIRMIHLRSHLNKLLETVRHAQYIADKTREELKKCTYQIEQYEDERDKLCREIQANESERNKPAVQRLEAAHRRVSKELEDEKKVEKIIRDKLEQAEYELALAEVERGKYILAEDDLLQREDQLNYEKAEMAIIRLQNEEILAKNAVASKNKENRKRQDALNGAERRHIQAMEEAEKSHERANRYLCKTLAKLKKRQQEEQDRYNVDMARKMDMLLKLKNDIANNRENLRVIWARDKAAEKKKKLAEQEEINKILAEGGNVQEMLLIKKRRNEMEKKKQQFEADQKLKRANIVKKILREEENQKRKYQLQPYLWTDPEQEKALRVSPLKKKLPKVLLDYIESGTDDKVDAEKADDEVQKEVKEFDVRSSDSYFANEDYRGILARLALNTAKNFSEMATLNTSKNKLDIGEEAEAIETSEENLEFSDEMALLEEEQMDEEEEEDGVEDIIKVPSFERDLDIDVEDEEETQVDLAQPEFEGLWSKETKSYKLAKETDSLLAKPVKGSKMEQEILKKTLDKTREGIVITQVAAGKEFSGCPFYSKPSVIHFKDFVVGKSYKKKVILTNVSHTLNYIRYLEVTDNLKDFIKIIFEPPGQMSAGMTCEITVTFKPVINMDLKGEVCFLAQTGPFQIPLICSTKKCDLTMDKCTVDFGTSVIGETRKQFIVLTNRGALGTRFTFYKFTGRTPPMTVYLEQQIGSATASVQNLEQQPRLTSMRVDHHEGLNKIEELERESVDTFAEQKISEKDLTSGVVLVEVVSRSEQELVKGTEEEVSSPCLTLDELEDVSALDGLRVGPLSEGEIAPFSSVCLEIIWQPTIPGNVITEFICSFADPNMKPISVHVIANAIDVPVWVERQTVDLKICMFDRLYQDTIIFNNRASTTQKLQFEVCKELRSHLELLPKNGYIQANSQFSAQLKFLPRQSLFKEAAKFFDPETGVLEAPMTVHVTDQVIPVCFTVQAVVTTSDLEFGVCNIDFGFCTIHESVKQTITLTNKSILPQKYGFVGLPDYLEVQPNDGFGTLLPLETIELDVIFSPKAAKEYEMNLLCRTLINRDFSISCKGVGVLTPLELSKQVIHFRATPLYDTSCCALHVINNHTSTNEYTHPVPRIGKGEIFPVGPTSFEFKVPKDAPITISPSVGIVKPGQKHLVQIRFSPTLTYDDIRLEAIKIHTALEAEREEKEREEAALREKQIQETARSKRSLASSRVSITKSISKLSAIQSVSSISEKVIPQFDPDNLNVDSPVYQAAIVALTQQFKGHFQSITVPCYVASGQADSPGDLNYSIHNTLYLEVHCPAIRPPVVVISGDGQRVVDFENVFIGQTCSKSVTVLNISDEELDLRATLLNPAGPFQMLNALRTLPPGAAHTILLTFSPIQGHIFQESLRIKTLNSTLHITLKGRGVKPMVNLSITDCLLDMKAVLVGECVQKPFTMENLSPLSVNYSIKQDSISPLRYSNAQNLPPFLESQESQQIRNYVGPQNKSGRNVFDVLPATGTIQPGESKEIIMTFAPDHESDLYSDGIRIDLFCQDNQFFFQVIGQCKSQVMFMEGCDPLLPPMESLAYMQDEESAVSQGPTVISQPALITVQSVVDEDHFRPGEREIYVGCVQTMTSAQKRGGEFTVDGLHSLQEKGFMVQPQKGSVEAGTKIPIVFTWMPPPDFDPNSVIEETVTLTLRSDTTEQIQLLIRAMAVSG